jgi:predicted PurR-regulated permease PerM
MAADSSNPRRGALSREVVEAAVQIGILVAVVGWCVWIVLPFVVPVIWAIVIAVAVHPLHLKIARTLGGRPTASAALLTVIGLAILIVPTVGVSGSAIETGTSLARSMADGKLHVPPPPEGVAEWPIVGKPIDQLWTTATANLADALVELRPQLEVVGAWLLSSLGGFGAAFIQFVISVAIAGALLARAPESTRIARAISRRLSEEHGDAAIAMSVATVRSVANGVLGIAIFQAILAGAGMAIAGVPYAGIWALLVLVAAVVQLPPLLILGPIIIWVFSAASTAVAVIFAIWSVAVSLSDAALKPLLLGRGVDVPMFVILLGAIGGMITSGIIGLFLGAVVLALGYKLFLGWLGELPVEAIAEAD